MNNSKTLKDMEVFEVRQDLELEGVEYPLIDKNELKQEAIKWVRHWLKVLGNPTPVMLINKDFCIGFKNLDMDRMNISQRDACVSMGAFVNFFNISKEELDALVATGEGGKE